MIVSPDILRRDMVKMLSEIDGELKKYREEAELYQTSPFLVKDQNGNAQYGLLLAARVQGMTALAHLNEKVRTKNKD